jgi:hypothetical protein
MRKMKNKKVLLVAIFIIPFLISYIIASDFIHPHLSNDYWNKSRRKFQRRIRRLNE